MYNNGNSSKNVTGASIVDGTVETVDIADDAVTADKLANTVNTDIATGVTASTTAGDALPKAGGAMTGAITTNSTFDGRDVATDGAALDVLDLAINSTANAAAITIDANENVGIGVTPNAWSGSYTALDMGDAFGGGIAVRNAASSPQSQAWVTSNTYRSNDSTTDTSGWTAKAGHLCAALGIGLQGGSALKFMTSGWTAAGAVVSFTEKVTMDGDGIKFNGDTAAANALDDYEEGTWTPAYTATSLVATYSTQIGTYTKVGNLVTLNCNISPNAITTAGTGKLTITGLPFTAASTASGKSSASISHSYAWASNPPAAGRILANSTTFEMAKATGTSTFTQGADLGAGALLFFTISYRV